MSGSGVLSSSWVSPDSRAESLPAVRQKFHLTPCAKIRDHLSIHHRACARQLKLKKRHSTSLLCPRRRSILELWLPNSQRRSSSAKPGTSHVPARDDPNARAWPHLHTFPAEILKATRRGQV